MVGQPQLRDDQDAGHDQQARADGDADLRLLLRGPRGVAKVRVAAQLIAGEWSTPHVAFEGGAR
jgi:hypothetical protein